MSKIMFSDLYDRVSNWKHLPLVSKTGLRMLQVAIIGFLIVQIAQQNLAELMAALPRNPLFYIFGLVVYFTLPLSEILTYGVSWDFRFKDAFPVFMKKRVLNKDVLGYSGEIQLFLWAQSYQPKASKKELMKVIRDNNILSSIATTIVVFGLLAYFFLSDQVAFDSIIRKEDTWLYIAGGIALSVIVGVLFYYRRFFFSMSKKAALSVFSIHIVRFLAINALQIAMWAVVLPDIELEIWFTYLSVLLINSRIPFIPNRDILFIALGTELSTYFNVAEASILGLLLTQSIMDKLLNAGFFLLFSRKIN